MLQRVKPCSLDKATQQLITNIFSKDMFNNSMKLMNLGEGRWAGHRGQGPSETRRHEAEPHPSANSFRCEEDAPRKAKQATDCPRL